MSLEIGDVIQDKYRIVRLLGQGGMGAVYEGENLAIARRVAIKVLFGTVANQKGVVERFEREAQAAGRIGNDHILEVLDLGTLPDGNRFMVMEFLDGETLGERTKRLGPMPPEQLQPLAKQLLTGLSAAHRAGIIHRDLKPDNIFILREKAGHRDYVKIIDFGISKFTTLDQDMKMTATGAVMGTPYFMSPEQAQGSGVADPRSDLYAVGVILYKAATGQVPFDGETFNELLFKIVLAPLPQPRSLVPELDPAFESIIQKAMARSVERRFQTAEEFIQALDEWKASGTAVSIPPPEETGLSGAVLGNTAEFGNGNKRGGTQIALTPSTGTGAKSWTQPDLAPFERKSSHASLWIGAAVLGVLIVGGLGFWLLDEDEAPKPEPTLAAEAPADPRSEPSPAATAPAPSPTPQVLPVDEPKPSETGAPSAPPAAEPVSDDPEPDSPTAPAAKPPVRATKPALPVTKAPPAPAAPRPKAPAPPAAKPPKKSGSPDFGY